MYLGSYRFDGDPDELVAAYDTLMAGFPADAILWHTCVRDDRGLTVFDACPSREIFRVFSVDPHMRAAMSGAGLPEPVVTELGDIHHVQAAPGRLAW